MGIQENGGSVRLFPLPEQGGSVVMEAGANETRVTFIRSRAYFSVKKKGVVTKPRGGQMVSGAGLDCPS